MRFLWICYYLFANNLVKRPARLLSSVPKLLVYNFNWLYKYTKKYQHPVENYSTKVKFSSTWCVIETVYWIGLGKIIILEIETSNYMYAQYLSVFFIIIFWYELREMFLFHFHIWKYDGILICKWYEIYWQLFE